MEFLGGGLQPAALGGDEQSHGGLRVKRERAVKELKQEMGMRGRRGAENVLEELG